jgi:hypothetical protein
MIENVQILLEVLFIVMILIHMTATNKSMTRLEEKIDDLDTEVFKQSVKPEIVMPAPRKKRVRKLRVAGETV